MVEYLGGTRYLYGRLPDDATIAVEAREALDIRPGEQIGVTFNEGDVMIFNASGERIRSATQSLS
jgi:lactose/L-arabinose transport system ATP-binding protein